MAQDTKPTQLGKYTEAVKKAAGLNLADVAIAHAVEVEKDRVTTLAKTVGVSAVSKLEALEAQIKKEDKPDNVSYVNNGGEFTKQDAYTAQKFEALQKLRESYKKLSEAFEKAMSTGTLVDFETLEKVLNSTK